jgi:hypothetical protein
MNQELKQQIIQYIKENYPEDRQEILLITLEHFESELLSHE